MKHLRNPLALLLALMLAFGIGASAMAEEIELETEAAMESPAEIAEAPVTPSAVDWNGLYVITDLPEDLYVPRGESFTLSVEISVPDAVEVKYQWYVGYGDYVPIEGATSPTLQLSSNDAYYPKAGNPHSQIVKAGSRQSFFYCKVTVLDGEGTQLTQWTSNATDVRVQGTLGEWLYSVTVRPLKGAAGWVWNAFLGLVGLPIRVLDFIALVFYMIFSGNRLPG